jgi:DHA1 family bicyclomycin/chloramphenicol resistance-like MFS transporter
LGERALILLLSLIVTIGSVATNIYIPALPAVRDDFGASVAEVQTTFSVALLTFAIGMLFWGPFADRYGRRAALLGGIALMTVGAAACVFAPTLGWLVLGRGVLAFGTATGIAVTRTIVSDLFPDRMARMLARLAIVAVVASASAPIVGGVLTEALGWRSVFWAQVVFGFAIAWLVWRYLPETRATAHAPPNLRQMAAASRALLAKPIYLSCVVQTSAAYSTFVVFISLAPYVMVQALDRSPTEYGLYYPLISIGYVLGNWAMGRFAAAGQQRLIAAGVALQLVAAGAAVAFVAAGLTHPLWIFGAMGVLYFGQGLFMPHLTAIAVSQAPANATGVGSSTLGFLNQLASALCVQGMGLTGGDSALPMLWFVAGAAVLQWVTLRLSPRMETAGNAP